jgi:hypothetical protein
MGEAWETLDGLREVQPSNIAHPDYYKFCNEWEIRDSAIVQCTAELEQLKDRWLGNHNIIAGVDFGPSLDALDKLGGQHADR